jgi:hypothetical protein
MMKRTDEEEEVFVDKLPGSHVKRRRRIKSDLLLDCNDAKQQKAQQREVGEENDKHLDINLSFKENQVEGKTAGFTMAAAATSSFGRSESMYLGADNNEMKLRKGPLKKRLSPKLTPVSTARAKAMDATTPANKYINGVETAATAATATATATKTAPETATKLPPDLLRSHTSGSGFSSLSSLNASFSSTTPLFCRKLMSSDAKKGGYCMVPPQLSLKRTLSKQLMEEPLLKTPISLSTSMKERLPLSAETLPSFSSSYSWSRTPMAFSVSKKSKSYHPVTTTQKFGSHEETGNMPNIAAASASTVDIIRITHPYGTNPHVTIKKRPKTPFLSPLANSGSKAHNVSTRNNNTSRSDDPFSENAIEDKTASDNGATLLKATEAKAPSGITKNVISKGKTSKRKVAALPTATEAKGRLEMASENAVNGIGKQPKLAKAIARSERGVSENVIEGKNMKKNAAKKPRAKKKLINPFLDPLLFDNGSIALTKRPCRCGSTRQAIYIYIYIYLNISTIFLFISSRSRFSQR